MIWLEYPTSVLISNIRVDSKGNLQIANRNKMHERGHIERLQLVQYILTLWPGTFSTTRVPTKNYNTNQTQSIPDHIQITIPTMKMTLKTGRLS